MVRFNDTEKIVQILLRKQFMQELKDGLLYTNDMTQLIIKSQESLDKAWEGWLVKEGFAEKVIEQETPVPTEEITQ